MVAVVKRLASSALLKPSATAARRSLADTSSLKSTNPLVRPAKSSGCASTGRSGICRTDSSAPVSPAAPGAAGLAAPGAVVAAPPGAAGDTRSEEHTSELQSLRHLVCRLLLEKN